MAIEVSEPGAVQLNAGQPAEPPEIEVAPSRTRQVISRLRGNAFAKAGLILLGVITLLAILAGFITSVPPTEQRLALANQPPSWLGGEGGVFGTDQLGRDVFSRMLFGARTSLVFGLVTGTGSALMGLTMGLLAGYYNRYFGPILMRFVDIQFAIPFIAIGLALVSVVGPGLLPLSIIFIVWGWTGFARTIYSSVIQVKAADHIAAVRVHGASNKRIIFRHILPNVIGPVIILWSTVCGVLILAESALSLLGLGVQPPGFSLGTLLADGQKVLRVAWWVAVFPGVMIGLIVVGFQLLGDALRDSLTLSDSVKRLDPDLS